MRFRQEIPRRPPYFNNVGSQCLGIYLETASYSLDLIHKLIVESQPQQTAGMIGSAYTAVTKSIRPGQHTQKH